MANANQTQLVLEYMKTHGSIDQLRAANDLGCFRLAARIADLKAQGVPVARTIRTTPKPANAGRNTGCSKGTAPWTILRT